MEPEQRTEREITYQVGWKRGKIKLNTAHPVDCGEPAAQIEGTKNLLSGIDSLNLRWLWRPVGLIKDEVLQVVLWVFPVIAFGISMWLIYKLSFQP
ncbi:hypothetical protein GC093_32470 [Paenibacillus sp. LMG 31456]|uniref:Uncharacterized protein n=1 Tax=Paenibacillus foliorum TaxID=2654974 RepID=A0A972H7N3_9BACL|nr:hypothetical protein [Paenibacillus foliorum]NOU97906.1 hypothetical protein [Paenibacillus foliorum]